MDIKKNETDFNVFDFISQNSLNMDFEDTPRDLVKEKKYGRILSSQSLETMSFTGTATLSLNTKKQKSQVFFHLMI